VVYGEPCVGEIRRGKHGGRVAVIEHVSPPGSGSPLHRHTREDEWFYVIDGELTFAVGDEVIPAPAGSFVYGRAGSPTLSW